MTILSGQYVSALAKAETIEQVNVEVLQVSFSSDTST